MNRQGNCSKRLQASASDGGAVVEAEVSEFGDLVRMLLREDAVVRFRAHGRSMRPFIHDGDLVTVAPARSDLRKGDVVVYEDASGAVIVHRLVCRGVLDGRKVFLVRGDASSGSPQIVDPAKVLGKVTTIERNGRVVLLGAPMRRSMTLWALGLRRLSRRAVSRALSLARRLR